MKFSGLNKAQFCFGNGDFGMYRQNGRLYLVDCYTWKSKEIPQDRQNFHGLISGDIKAVMAEFGTDDISMGLKTV